VRPEEKHRTSGRTVLNQVQWWRHEAKAKLIAFYRQALAIGQTLPADVITWGADTEPIRQLIEPIEIGEWGRSGLTASLIHHAEVMESLSRVNINRLETGEQMRVGRPVLDFRYTRKHHMRAAFNSLFRVSA
jgi:hypothetical protein